MQKRDYKTVMITNKGERSVLLGHPWIYSGEVIKEDKGIINGDIVDVINEKEKYLGSGFYNNNSKIIIRLISRNTNDKFDSDFFKRRLKYAWDYRKSVMGSDLNACRIIFGEADELPGLTVDKFNDILVVQILSLGIELRKEIILKDLYDVLSEDNIIIKGIYEREDAPIRLLEGLEEFKGWFDIGIEFPKETSTIITENDLKYRVDFENGQKTGYFLDQKYNRLLIRKLAKDKKVLDCCTHTGSFAMNAYLGGAKYVKALDISDKAIEDAKENFKLNNMQIDTEVGDVFKVLENMVNQKDKTYDFIILDPPAFTKSRKTIDSALKGYEEINYLAMKALPRGGFLATATCSHFASEEMFKKALMNASIKADVKLKQVSFTGPAPDHPELWNVPETKYLKFFIFQII
jgi:23S rRNA (cytosine1962-C5)-methyltransferase